MRYRIGTGLWPWTDLAQALRVLRHFGLGTELRRYEDGTLIALVVQAPWGHQTITPSIYATPDECALIYQAVCGRLCS